MRTIFISYRRDDTKDKADRLYEILQPELKKVGRRLFMDVDDIPLGKNFESHLAAEFENCELILVLIGPAWINAADKQGGRRLDDPEDFVRMEVSTAIKRGIRIVPVCFDDAPIPAPRQLPDDIRELSSLQAFRITRDGFLDDALRLLKRLDLLDAASRAVRSATNGAPIEERKFRDQLKLGGLAPEMMVIHDHLARTKSTMGDASDQRYIQQTFRSSVYGISLTPVTWEDYLKGVPHCRRPMTDGFGEGPRPVTNVSWWDAKSYCDWLSDETGRHYRLPSEIEWEFACLSNRRGLYSTGDTISQEEANFDSGSLSDAIDSRERLTSKVRTYPPNDFGLYDFHGNVWEWVSDEFIDRHKQRATAISEKSAVDADIYKVYKGGSWLSGPAGLQADYRDWTSAYYRAHDLGFRIACDLEAFI